MMEIKETNTTLQKELEAVYEEDFDFKRQMRHFQREMERTKEGWREKMEKVEKKEIKWQWTANNGKKFDGKYEGEAKNNKPHGLGKWANDDGYPTVEGEWKDGQLHGKAVENWDGTRDEYEAKDGK